MSRDIGGGSGGSASGCGESKQPMTLEQTLQALYKSEINAMVATEFDGGVWVSLLDENLEPFSPTYFDIDDFQSAADYLAKEAVRRFPESEFARQIRSN